VYPDQRIARFIMERFIPVRVHVRDQADEFKRLGEHYGVQWTPGILELDEHGNEQHRIEGFLDADALLAQLALGVGKSAFKAKRWQEAERALQTVVDRHPDSEAAPEAAYWAGVSRYQETHDPRLLTETFETLDRKYHDSPWRGKASVWRSSG
jgi:TolA-binding protein